MTGGDFGKKLRLQNGALTLLIGTIAPQIPPWLGQNEVIAHVRILTCRCEGGLKSGPRPLI